MCGVKCFETNVEEEIHLTPPMHKNDVVGSQR